jgi:hypothetical protein
VKCIPLSDEDSMEGDGIDMSSVRIDYLDEIDSKRRCVVFYFCWTSSVLPFSRRRRTRYSM